MLETALTIAFGLFVLALLLNLYRLVRGPTLPDRALALDTMYIMGLKDGQSAASLILENLEDSIFCQQTKY